MKQAVLNLCLNALDAMPKGGVLTLSLAKEGGRVRLRVSDTGIGMAPELLKSIFNPYFTTKGNGTGMGLAIVHKIIEAHGGEIDVTSRPATEKRAGQTSFTLWLPEAGKS
jgi:two-component system, NtrC family, sensor histidine kinase HydH